jgi:OFA family oxalate/formate antiporter-like MFS transporter
MVQVFATLGVAFMILAMTAGSFLKNPPAGYIVPGYTASGAATGSAVSVAAQEQTGTFAQYVFSGRFFIMWVIFFCNITAGIAIIGFQSPLMQDLVKAAKPDSDVASLAAAGALLIGISSLFNGLGRFFWGGTSDKIGRVQVFRIMLITQIIAFIALMFIKSPLVFGVVVCYILLCYGGGFGTMPSFVTTVFGTKMMAVVYGAILTAWSCAGIVGPQVLAILKDKLGAQASFYAFGVSAGFLTLGLIFSFIASNKPFELKK